jgi:hypothetical protein
MISLDIRAALERHWAAFHASDFETEHEIYRDDAILDRMYRSFDLSAYWDGVESLSVRQESGARRWIGSLRA